MRRIARAATAEFVHGRGYAEKVRNEVEERHGEEPEHVHRIHEARKNDPFGALFDGPNDSLGDVSYNFV